MIIFLQKIKNQIVAKVKRYPLFVGSPLMMLFLAIISVLCVILFPGLRESPPSTGFLAISLPNYYLLLIAFLLPIAFVADILHTISIVHFIFPSMGINGIMNFSYYLAFMIIETLFYFLDRSCNNIKDLKLNKRIQDIRYLLVISVGITYAILIAAFVFKFI